MEGLILIESLTKDYSTQYNNLSESISEMDREIEVIKSKYMPLFRRQIGKVKESGEKLKLAIEENKGCFEKPKTHIFHGIKVGYQKGKGKLEYDNESVVKLIHKHFEDKADTLIETTERVVAKAIEQLTIPELKKLGVHVVEAQDEIVIKSTDSDIKKVINKIISQANEESLT